MNAAATPPVPHRRLIAVFLMMATVMQALDTTIANVALPHIQGSLSASEDQITWVLTSYLVAAAIMTPVTGWLAGRYGRKRLFLWSTVGFTAASALCGMASSLDQIVLFRMLQGVCGAALIPLSQAVLLDINPANRHGQAMAVWGMGIMVGPILGPALGGWITDNYSWRWCFYINLPIGVMTFLGLLAFVKETRHDKPSRFDFFGFSTLSLGIAGLQVMLDRGELKGWFGSTEIWIEAALAALGFYWFAIHTWTARKISFLNPALLRDGNFVAASAAGIFLGLLVSSTLALLPTMMQNSLGYPVVTTGLVMAPRGIGTLFTMFIVGRAIGRIDTRIILAIGLGTMGLAQWQMSHFSLEMGMAPVIWSGVLQGVGIGFTFVPLSTIAFATLSPELRTEGAGLFTLVRNIGSSVGISIVQAILVENTQIVHSSLVQHIGPGSLYGPVSVSTPSGLAFMNAEVTRQAAMVAYVDDFRFMTIVALATIPLLLLMRPPAKAGNRAVHVAVD